MDYTNEIQIIETVSAVLAILTTMGGLIIGIYRIVKNRYKSATYYVSRGVFSDRVDVLRDLVNRIRCGTKVINIYGKRGIGKSAFLRFFCDFTNRKLNRENRKQRYEGKRIQRIRGRAIYIHLTGTGADSIDDQIVTQIVGFGNTLAEIAKHIPERIRHGKIIIVIDNVNNAGLSKDIEAVIDTFFAYSQRYCIIVGSIEKQPFLNITKQDLIKYIELPVFGEADLFDFARKNAKGVPFSYLSKVLDFSEGLPVFISLLLSNDVDVLSDITFDGQRMDRYLGRIIDDLDDTLHTLALYIGFLSITNSVLDVHLLKDIGVDLPPNCFEKLENYALIEYDSEKETVKMHELFRNYICRYFGSAKSIVTSIYEYYCHTGSIFEQAYYLIMLDIDATDTTISTAVKQAISCENYAFLIMLGEHYKRMYDWHYATSNLSEDMFLMIIYGYIEGLIGVGNYPAAQEVIDKCKVPARSPKSDIQFLFSLTTAQLYHLQNQYELAIASYEILLTHTQTHNKFNKYESKCLWGIAHSLRHEGKDLDTAIMYYDQSIEAATRLNRKSEIIKSMREKLTILLCRNQMEEAKVLHKKICLLIKGLPKDGYVATRLSFLKTEVTYMRAIGDKNAPLQYRLLLKVYSSYKKQRKRLQYNINFLFGEYYRKKGHITLAKENYTTALTFSRKNHDRNLETLSQIALILCGIAADQNEISNFEKILVDCIITCEECNLHTNRLLGEVILAYIQGKAVDESIVLELERLRYEALAYVAKHLSIESLDSLDLYLM